MIPRALSAFAAAVATALGNHLWQSTLCVAIAGLLTLVLRKNHARARYGLWLASSIKFLIPFSLLISLGTHLARPRVEAPTDTSYFFAVEEVGQPFTKPPGAIEKRLPPELAADYRYRLLPAIPPIVAVVWLGGFLLVLVGWWRRWRQVAESLEGAEPLQDGRELQALRRMERLAGVRRPINLMASPSSMEPGIFGIVHPVLVWPAGISERLQDAHLEAILAHEVEHVRRQDNLAAAVHMFVEAAFWFHPLVWWLGTRMVEERELACDEAVVELGSERQAYAESILKTCQYCLESPLACVSGITGAELKKRIVRIMTQHSAGKLSIGKKLLLVALAVAAIAGPVVFGLVNAPEIHALTAQTTAGPLPTFEVASIKQNRSGSDSFRLGVSLQNLEFTAKSVTTKALVEFAYEIKSDDQISGGPSWINSDKFDIEAKQADADVERLKNLPQDQRWKEIRLQLQSLLSERFKLRVNHASRELSAYSLVVVKSGAKLTAATPPTPAGGDHQGPQRFQGTGLRFLGRGHLAAQSTPIHLLADVLSRQLGRLVVDDTGLRGNYDFELQWTPDPSEPGIYNGPAHGNPGANTTPPPDASGPSIFTAIQEQLGLRLESTKRPVEVIVIDHIERPSEN